MIIIVVIIKNENDNNFPRVYPIACKRDIPVTCDPEGALNLTGVSLYPRGHLPFEPCHNGPMNNPTPRKFWTCGLQRDNTCSLSWYLMWHDVLMGKYIDYDELHIVERVFGSMVENGCFPNVIVGGTLLHIMFMISKKIQDVD